LIGKLSIPEERELPIPLSNLAVCSPELVRCFRHERERCPRCDGSGYRSRVYCAECGQPAGRPSQGGKALMGLRNRRGRDQPFYCLDCHPELGQGPAVLEGMGG
jgi:hypothetical protein